MKRIHVILIALTATLVASAQDSKSSFDEFRQGMMSRYQSFRKSVLDDYASYLDGVWKDYQAFKAEKRMSEPKPKEAPVADPKPDTKPFEMPVPSPMPDFKPVGVPSAKIPDAKPFNPSVPKDIDPIKVKPVVVTPKPEQEMCKFQFYGVTMSLPRVRPAKIYSLNSSSLATSWRYMMENKVTDILPYVRKNVAEYGLGDWFTMEYIMSYSKSLMPSASASERMALVHFIMANLGYDVRLGIADNQAMIMLPFEQNVYERTFLEIDGKRYYLVFDKLNEKCSENSWISTCTLPDNVDKGRTFNGIITTSMNMPQSDMKEYTLTDGTLSIKGKVNSTVVKMLDSYISLDIPWYAASNVVTPFKQDVLNQLRPQIAGKKEMDAVQSLLHFCQYCFRYATDQDQFDREKYFFFEENFYYPKNDCEDRAIFFAYLVHNLLGLDVHLIQFPGHECTAIHFNNVEPGGTYYTFKGKKYFICDPTYIGAGAGQCMSQYRNTEPIIQQWY